MLTKFMPSEIEGFGKESPDFAIYTSLVGTAYANRTNLDKHAYEVDKSSDRTIGRIKRVQRLEGEKKTGKVDLEYKAGEYEIDRSIEAGMLEYSLSNPRFVVARNPVEYAKILIAADYLLKFKNEDLWRMYEHETSHFRKALEVGFPEPFFRVLFSEDREGSISIHPQMVYGKIPDAWEHKEVIEKYGLVLDAPKDPSHHDKRELDAKNGKV